MLNLALTGWLAVAALWSNPNDAGPAARIICNSSLSPRAKGELLTRTGIIRPGLSYIEAKRLLGPWCTTLGHGPLVHAELIYDQYHLIICIATKPGEKPQVNSVILANPWREFP